MPKVDALKKLNMVLKIQILLSFQHDNSQNATHRSILKRREPMPRQNTGSFMQRQKKKQALAQVPQGQRIDWCISVASET